MQYIKSEYNWILIYFQQFLDIMYFKDLMWIPLWNLLPYSQMLSS